MKPIELDIKKGVLLGAVTVIVSAVALFERGDKFVKLIFDDDFQLNWKLTISLIVLVALIVWFIMNQLWIKDHKKLLEVQYDRDNYKAKLKIRDNERLVDVITGIPNSISLKADFDNYLTDRFKEKQHQFILIDLKDFRKINKEFGFIKTNTLLRVIAQHIYKGMRRNEDMYKYLLNNSSLKQEKFYRLHTGGDEFVFIIEGEQYDAVGFCNRLVDRFKEISKSTKSIIGKEINLSFHSAIIEIDPRDSYEDIIRKAHDCYSLAKEGNSEFNLAWHPNTTEDKISINKLKGIYKEAREKFDVMSISSKLPKVE